MVKENEKYLFHSSNGKDYTVTVLHINNSLEPERKYACDMKAKGDKKSYMKLMSDYYYCGDEFLSRCKKV